MSRRYVCPWDEHCYDNVIKSKDIEYQRGIREYHFDIALAVMCTKCGDVIFPDYPHKFGVKELERIANKGMSKAERKIKDSIKKRKK